MFRRARLAWLILISWLFSLVRLRHSAAAYDMGTRTSRGAYSGHPSDVLGAFAERVSSTMPVPPRDIVLTATVDADDDGPGSCHVSENGVSEARLVEALGSAVWLLSAARNINPETFADAIKMYVVGRSSYQCRKSLKE